MKYLSFDIAIRLIHNIRYVKGRLIKRPLFIDKNTSKQPKGTKNPSKPTKPTKKKPVSSKKATQKPSPEPSPEKSPAHSTGGEESNGSLTDHSFYNLASDKDLTKKTHSAQKSPPKDKSPAHEEHHNKPPSASPPPPDSPLQAHLGMIQSPALITSLASAMLLLAPGTLCWPTTSATLTENLKLPLPCPNTS
ncbi:hypothetical protein DSO57_1009709 [Entomophthora muscae]|uniref:Uncharacterized protein n=1 Tax=Entomophthora muscae TaxID=34485 RepID=A0ACC2UFP2_9FUNG|nr:hypothetical protein DSO57_1009709 [Entomophthora muscae]